MSENTEKYYNYSDFDYYQAEAKDFAIYKDKIYPFLGLAEEAGEVCGKIAKFHRDAQEGDKLELEPVVKELGDVLWMVAACCNELGVNLADVAMYNINKLRDRKERDVIGGEGDER